MSAGASIGGWLHWRLSRALDRQNATNEAALLFSGLLPCLSVMSLERLQSYRSMLLNICLHSSGCSSPVGIGSRAELLMGAQVHCLLFVGCHAHVLGEVKCRCAHAASNVKWNAYYATCFIKTG